MNAAVELYEFLGMDLPPTAAAEKPKADQLPDSDTGKGDEDDD